MYRSAHQVTGSIINHAMAGDSIFSGKDRGNDFKGVVTAVAGAGVAGMPLRVVPDEHGLRLQGGQPLAQPFDGFGVHAGSTFLKGLTTTFS